MFWSGRAKSIPSTMRFDLRILLLVIAAIRVILSYARLLLIRIRTADTGIPEFYTVPVRRKTRLPHERSRDWNVRIHVSLFCYYHLPSQTSEYHSSETCLHHPHPAKISPYRLLFNRFTIPPWQQKSQSRKHLWAMRTTTATLIWVWKRF